MSELYQFLTIIVITIGIIYSFSAGFKIGRKCERLCNQRELQTEPQKQPLIETVKEFISDTIESVSKNKKIEETEVKQVETVDGRKKDVRKFF